MVGFVRAFDANEEDYTDICVSKDSMIKEANEVLDKLYIDYGINSFPDFLHMVDYDKLWWRRLLIIKFVYYSAAHHFK